jgi:6-phosphogluconate dehydrogenase
VIENLVPQLSPNDIVIDGGNSHFKESIKRYNYLKSKQIAYLDCGTSGGTSGALHGACTMIGGDAEVFAYVEDVFKAISLPGGYLYTGGAGSGHFVKMVHNGIEYGMMQAFAEGFSLLGAKKEFDLDLAAVGELWRHGSVVRSWLLDLTAAALKEDAKLDSIQPFVPDSGEGRWTAIEGVELGIPTPVMTTALMARFASQGSADFGSKVLAKMRQGFGGHAVKKA